LRGEERLRVFEKRVLRKIFVLTRDEATAEWRRLHAKALRSYMVCTPHSILLGK
jgi:hypothetical protein